MSDQKYSILIADDSEIFRKFLTRYIQSLDSRFIVHTAGTGTDAFKIIQQERIDIAFLDNIMPDLSGMEILRNITERKINTQIVIISGYATIEIAVEAIKYGALGFIEKPIIDLRPINDYISKVLNTKKTILSAPLKREQRTTFIGQSKKIKEIKDLIEKISYSDSNVLINGESGTGKDIVAKLIHDYSKRKNSKFITVNCSAIPDTLIESELFGYKKGAFTGAIADRTGLFEEAEGGTLFLDEIGDMPLLTQAKVLRAIQNREIKPVGSNTIIKVNVRIIAATNKNLIEQIKKNSFREDLWYRLNVFSIQIPPLRERKEDIVFLAYYFLEFFNLILGKQIKEISKDVLQIFSEYTWEGNVRELENVMERMCVLETTSRITKEHLPERFVINITTNKRGNKLFTFQDTFKESKKAVVEEFERNYIESVLKKTGGNVTKAAEIAGMDRANFKKIYNRYFL